MSVSLWDLDTYCTVADPEVVWEVRGLFVPPFRQNYFFFKEIFQENQEKLINNQVKLISTPL